MPLGPNTPDDEANTQRAGFFTIWMGVLCLVCSFHPIPSTPLSPLSPTSKTTPLTTHPQNQVYMILALRTNVVFFLIFFTLVLAFGFLTAAYWYAAEGKALAAKMLVAGGACVGRPPPLSLSSPHRSLKRRACKAFNSTNSGVRNHRPS